MDRLLTVTTYESERAPGTARAWGTTWEGLAHVLSVSTETPCIVAPSEVTGVARAGAVDLHPGVAGAVELCVGHDCRWKCGRAWSPVRLRAGASYRLGGNVEAVTLVTFDADDVTNKELSEIHRALDGLEFVVHSTHSHLVGGPGCNRVRAVVLPTRDMTPEEWPFVWAGAYDAFGFAYVPATPATATSPRMSARGVDRTCRDPSRLWFVPTRPRGVEPLYHRGRGSPLDVDRLLERGRALGGAMFAPASTHAFAQVPSAYASVPGWGGGASAAPPSSGYAPSGYAPSGYAPSGAQAADLGELRKALVKYRQKIASSQEPEDAERYRIVSSVLDATALAQPGGRSATINTAVSILAFVLPLGTPWEALAEILRPSLAAMDYAPACGFPRNVEESLGIAHDSYRRASGRATVVAVERERKLVTDQSVSDALAAFAPPVLAPPAPPFTGGNAGGGVPFASSGRAPRLAHHMIATGGVPRYSGPVPVPGQCGEEWRKLLKSTADGKLVKDPWNLYVMLTYNPVFADGLRWNVVSKDIDVLRGLFVGYPTSTLSTAVHAWVSSACRLDIAELAVEKYLLLVAREFERNPIAEYLTSIQWDGAPRLERLFFDHIKTRVKSDDGTDLTEHLQRIGRKFLISAVARALNPGCQVDTMLVLEGPEGLGKTSFLRCMFGEWYTLMQLHLGDKDAKMVPSAAWGIEVGELSSVRRSDDEVLLAYLTDPVDRLRPPYGRRLEAFPRCSVLVGTTNQEHWLTPGKGKRRYWPVYVEAVDLAATARDRDQLWAEAVARYRGYVDMRTGEQVVPERWHLVQEERSQADAEAAARVLGTFEEDLIVEWWFRTPPEKRPKQFTLVNVCELALRLDVGRMSGQGSSQLKASVSTALKRLGFTADRRYGRLWTPDEGLLTATVAPGCDPNTVTAPPTATAPSPYAFGGSPLAVPASVLSDHVLPTNRGS